MNKKILGILAVLFVVLMVGAGALYSNLSEQVQVGGLATQPTEIIETEASEPAETADYSAPDFTVLDWEGNSQKLSEFVGKPIVLNFWASWCGPCKSEMPDFDEAYKKYGDEIHFLMVNCTGGRETVDSAKSFIEESGYSFPVYFDTTYEAASIYGASSIPLTYFIDAKGNLVTYGMGALSAQLLQTGIDMIYTPQA